MDNEGYKYTHIKHTPSLVILLRGLGELERRDPQFRLFVRLGLEQEHLPRRPQRDLVLVLRVQRDGGVVQADDALDLLALLV